MATLEKAEELLEQLRAASYSAAQRDLDDIKAFAAEQGFTEEMQQVRLRLLALVLSRLVLTYSVPPPAAVLLALPPF